jgi:hypothetical protein
VNSTFVPAGGAGPQPDDTAAFSSGVRVDYALPSIFGFTVTSWRRLLARRRHPVIPLSGAITAYGSSLGLRESHAQRRRLCRRAPNLLNYYAPAAGLTGSALQTALHNIIDDHVVIDYGTIDEVMQVIDEATRQQQPMCACSTPTPTCPKRATTSAGGWNREHVWPRSDGVGDEGA